MQNSVGRAEVAGTHSDLVIDSLIKRRTSSEPMVKRLHGDVEKIAQQLSFGYTIVLARWEILDNDNL